MENNENLNHENKLKELGGSDFKIVEGQPNIKGWTVKDQLGRTLGNVDELLFDPESRKVHYLVVEMDNNELDLDDREVLIPIGIAQLHENDDDVILPNITVDQLSSLPTYDYDSLNPEIEQTVYAVFAGAAASPLSAGTSMYDHNNYNENNLYQRRQPVSNVQIEGQTVIGIFDNGFDAQNAITQLKNSGFGNDDIDISTKDNHENNDHEGEISSFFGNLFSDHDEASRYTDLAKKGSVVTVHTSSADEANRAAKILDQHGAKGFDENDREDEVNQEDEPNFLNQQFSNQDDQHHLDRGNSERRVRSRIIQRHVAQSNRLRSDNPGRSS